jgi:hypothetical protein
MKWTVKYGEVQISTVEAAVVVSFKEPERPKLGQFGFPLLDSNRGGMRAEDCGPLF